MNFLIYELSDSDKIDMTQCISNSPLLIKNSLDNTKSFICYDTTPSFVNQLTNTQGPYNYSDMMYVLEGADWK
jgi:hypothetical protein